MASRALTHRLKLRRIAQEHPKLLGRLGRDADRLRERIAGDVDHVPDQLLGIDPRAPAFGPARERKDLLDQLRPVPRVVLDHPDQVAAFLIPFLHSQHFARDENGRQHVIEIVRDASRQRADALQPLRA
jgi:hypothetical protein